MKILGPIDPEEIKLISFPFADELEAGETMSLLSVTCAVSVGVDATAAARPVGAPVVIGTDLVQRMSGCVDGVTYYLRAKATGSTGLVHVVPGLLECKTAAP